MKLPFLTVPCCAFALALALPNSAVAQQKAPARSRAAAGDTVWVVVNPVSADKRAQFERFVNEIFWPAAAKLGPTDQSTFRHTRVLNPAKAEADGSYSYLFVMDPVLKGSTYDIETLLKKAYGAGKAAAYYKLFAESLAHEQKIYVTVQTRW